MAPSGCGTKLGSVFRRRRPPDPPTLPSPASGGGKHSAAYAPPQARGKLSPLGRELGDEPAPDGEQCRLGAIGNPQLLEDVADVRLHGLFRKRQPARDLLVGEAFG